MEELTRRRRGVLVTGRLIGTLDLACEGFCAAGRPAAFPGAANVNAFQPPQRYIMTTYKQTVDSLRYVDDGERPLTPYELATLQPSLGTGERPPAMAELAGRRPVYVCADGSPPEPVVRRVDGAAENLWRVDVPAGPEGEVCLPGRTALRTDPRELLSGIDSDVDLQACRPEWLDLFHVPRVLPRRSREPMRRANGDLVEPRLDPRFVFGDDNRQELNETSWPWGCVGKIVNSEGQHGAGALVGNRLVLTAAHAIPWRDVAAGNWWMHFVPTYWNGQSLHGAGVQSYVSDARAFPESTSTAHDWAVCRLYEPLGTPDRLGHFGTRPYNPAWNGQALWTHMGYPVNAWFLGASYQSGISIDATYSGDHDGLECENYGDITGGNSGGPMFAFFGAGNPRIIAVQAFGAVNEDNTRVNVAAGGPGLDKLVAWARTNWP
ncbi:trypsin-like serine peptidase [Streptomyces sp. NPDC058423]|uniref:trypsin-like serine peptidase n=1 Tax=unclassified Streptomyces TaxID=2593676 RepID=UPI003657CB5E